MAATVMHNPEETIKKLNHIIELDQDAIGVYKTAIERLESLSFKSKFMEFLSDHERHVEELSDAVRGEGGTPPPRGDAQAVLPKDSLVIATLGGDSAILRAMKANEDQANRAYERAVSGEHPGYIQTLLQTGLSDERRHRAWIESTLEMLP